MTPEFSHSVKMDQLGALDETIVLRAEREERKALAKRFDLLSLDRLEASLKVRRDGADMLVEGQMTATLKQACVATGAPVPAAIKEAMLIRYTPAITTDPDEEIELTDMDCDLLEFDGKAVDLGEAVAQTLGLAITPYPRSADAEALLRAAGVKQDDEVGAFSALAGLRDRLTAKS